MFSNVIAKKNSLGNISLLHILLITCGENWEI